MRMIVAAALVALFASGCLAPLSLTYSDKREDRLLWDCRHEEIACTNTDPPGGFPVIYAKNCIARGEDKAPGDLGRACRCMVDYAAKCSAGFPGDQK